jgi:arylsulfatase A-like enzyme
VGERRRVAGLKKLPLEKQHMKKLLLLSLFLVPQALFAASLKPNIVIILTDDQGYGDAGCYGARDMRTPHIDRLAGEGMRFDFFRANSPVCSPTRAALLTGCHPDRAGVPGVIRTDPHNSWGRLAADTVLLPTPLKAAGYHTAIIGKWHLGLQSPDTPVERGFDLFHGFLGDGVEDYWKHLRHGINYMRRNSEVIKPEGHTTDLYSDWACDYLRQRAKAPQPFFLYLSYNAPHWPIQPPPEWLEKVRRRDPGLPARRAEMVAFLEHLDDGIGRVLAAIEETGQRENTLVILTSDNGGLLRYGASNGATRAGKGSMYEGGLRVPFLARWPGRIHPGSRSDAAAVTMDIFPTVLEAGGAKAAAGIDGISLLPLLTGHVGILPERDLYFVRRDGDRYGGKTIEALIRNEWKLLQNMPFTPLELYNLKDDPLEKNNLLAENKKIASELSIALRQQIQRGGHTPWQ